MQMLKLLYIAYPGCSLKLKRTIQIDYVNFNKTTYTNGGAINNVNANANIHSEE